MRPLASTIVLTISCLQAISQDSIHVKSLDGVVVTGQYKPQSIKNSVYQVRVIDNRRIVLSGASNVQQVLNTQLGIRFSNDNTLGTSNIEMMGMSGRNVKILLDGIPLSDRGDTRESLNQVDVNNIERIEIVEGPMSVSYGSDALAGVINIITRKSSSRPLSVTARIQEETAGDEYYPFSYQGSHLQNIGIASGFGKWNISAGGTHNLFNGYGGDEYGRGKSWRPKEQWFGNGKLGYQNKNFNAYYRFDGLNEEISDRQPMNVANYKATDKYYITNRFMHQLQSQWQMSGSTQWASVISFTDYDRQTTTKLHDFQTGEETLTTGAGEQDLSKLYSALFRNSFYLRFSDKLSLQPGLDINYEKASGDRIAGAPSIADYALFVSAEYTPVQGVNLRPGLRFIKNSQYDAPPAIPSINTKFALSKTLDLRAAYAYGFRSPALRELYFSFHDANHDIVGNPDLKAEHSNSFNTSLNWTPVKNQHLALGSVLGGFYNIFGNQITLASVVNNGITEYTYVNILSSKTAGITFQQSVSWKNLDASAGFSYVGYYNSLYDDKAYVKTDKRDFLWSPELTFNLIYNLVKWKTRFSLFYKYTGEKPSFSMGTDNSGQDMIYVSKTAAYNIADFAINTSINKFLGVSAGVKNLFDVTDVQNTAQNSGVHSSGGPLAVGYGRSYFIGLNFQWHTK